MAGSEALTFTEMEAWSRLRRVRLDAVEVEVLRTLDRIRVRVSREQ